MIDLILDGHTVQHLSRLQFRSTLDGLVTILADSPCLRAFLLLPEGTPHNGQFIFLQPLHHKLRV